MEERGEVVGDDKTHRWIVDPLDGTTNFLHGVPLFAISIALEREGQIVAGVIYNPVSDELFTAEKGKGAYLNDRRVARGGAAQPAGEPAGNRHSPSWPRRARALCRECKEVIARVAGIRRTGAALDLAWTASGRFDAYWEHNHSRGTWQPGSCWCARRAAWCTDLQGAAAMFETGDIAVGNPYVHKQLLASCNRHRLAPRRQVEALCERRISRRRITSAGRISMLPVCAVTGIRVMSPG